MVRVSLLCLGAGALLALRANPTAPPQEAGQARQAESTPVACPADLLSVKRNIAHAARNYFLEHTHPVSGLVRVVARNFGPTTDTTDRERASIAATGFGMAVMAHAGKRADVSRAFALDYCKRTLEFLDANYDDVTWKGWFCHYLYWQPDPASGKAKRWENSEYSTIDTALLLAGALYAGRVFPGSRVAELADKFYAHVQFRDMMTGGGAAPAKRTLSLSYRLEPGSRGREAGYSPWQWDHYAEHMLLLILGLGSPNADHRLPPEAWTAWQRQTKTIELRKLASLGIDGFDPLIAPALRHREELIGYDRALFTHQYTHLFVDLRTFQDSLGVNYYRNSVVATLYNREVCLSDASSQTFRHGFWGLSAGDAPAKDTADRAGTDRVRYKVNTPERHDGTACVGSVPASAMFAPAVVLGDVVRWCRGPYGRRLWGRYGLADGINLDQGGPQGWISPKVHGITVGPGYLALANLEEATSVWRDFMANQHVRRGLNAAASAPRFQVQPKGKEG
jgi:hypothetical protein